jgi:hypothetical protein
MKGLKQLLTLILIGLVLPLSVARSSGTLEQRRNQSHQTKPDENNHDAEYQQTISPAFYAAILAELRTMVSQEIAKQKQEHSDRKDWNTKPFWIMFGLNAALVGVGSFYTFFAYQQLMAIRIQSRTLDLALKAERPYVLIESRQFAVVPALTPFSMAPTGWQHIIFTLDLHNFGKGVAIIKSGPIKLVLSLGMTDVDKTKLPRLPQTVARDLEKRPKTHVIGPGQKGEPWSDGLDIPNETWNLITDYQLTLMVVGIIFYQDVFGRAYNTKYALVYNPALARPGGSMRDVLWPAGDRHNRFT